MPKLGAMMRASRRREAALAHVQDVAAHILNARGRMSAMKLQKLCYYSYGCHLAWEERRLFPEPFEAWANGPVCPPLYQLHRGCFEVGPGDIKGRPEALDDGERESVNLVLSVYGDLTATQLSAMTHAEAPWVNARSRAGAAPMARSSERLDDEEIFEFFDALISASADEREV
jgi:uncharacterized phage-associated protein